MKRILSLAILFFIFSPIHANNKIEHVIYITLDGIRWQDVYQTQHYFPRLWSEHAKQLTFYGLPDSHTIMETTSEPHALPSYQAQMAGSLQPCHNNKCGHIQVKTLPEFLVDQLHFAKKDVAIFSSMPEISEVIETNLGTTFSNIGNRSMLDPVNHQADNIMAILNHEQRMNHPVNDAHRYDKYTFAQALHYFEKYQPKFLWISLTNADDEAHLGNHTRYHQLLNYYDDALHGLFLSLKTMKLDKNTMVIVTTDHGRGNNENWTSHGSNLPESRQIFAFVMNGKLEPANIEDGVEYYNTLSIRPAIEKVFY